MQTMGQSVYCWGINSVWQITTEPESLERWVISYFSQSGKNLLYAESFKWLQQTATESVCQPKLITK